MARAGRPRKLGRRTKSGRIARKSHARGVDRGTEELQAMRFRLANGEDPALTSYPLGILEANGIITTDQRKAACRYAWLHAVVIGRPNCASMALERRTRSQESEVWDEEWLEEQEDKFDAVRRLLSPARMRMVLENVAVYERLPGFFERRHPRPSDAREAELLNQACLLLERHFNRKIARAA